MNVYGTQTLAPQIKGSLSWFSYLALQMGVRVMSFVSCVIVRQCTKLYGLASQIIAIHGYGTYWPSHQCNPHVDGLLKVERSFQNRFHIGMGICTGGRYLCLIDIWPLDLSLQKWLVLVRTMNLRSFKLRMADHGGASFRCGFKNELCVMSMADQRCESGQ